MFRFAVSDPDDGFGFAHVFDELTETGVIVPRNRLVRFVFDRDECRLLTLDIFRDRTWQSSTEEERHHLQNEILFGNKAVMRDPEQHGLITMDEPPFWCRSELAMEI